MCFKQVHVFNMFVLKGKSRLITDKNIFALCFKEYLKKERSKSRYDHRFKSRSGFRIAFPKKRGSCVFVVVCVDMFCSECKGKC